MCIASKGLDQSTTVLQFQAAIAEKSGVPVERQELLLGTMPPKVLKVHNPKFEADPVQGRGMAHQGHI